MGRRLTNNIRSGLNILKFKRKREKGCTSDSTQVFVEQLLLTKIKNINLYKRALTHRSYDNVGQLGSNERLEYLGDSVINCAVGHFLYELYPDDHEGTLTSIRSYIVNRNHLNNVATKLGIESVLKVDESTDLKNSDILGNALEALVGAIYLDLGFQEAANFVKRHLVVSKKNLKVISKKEEDYKTEFIILMQKYKVRYTFEHIDSHFEKKQGAIIHRCELLIGPEAKSIATGVGTSKKTAHQNAAKDALRMFEKEPQLLEEFIT